MPFHGRYLPFLLFGNILLYLNLLKIKEGEIRRFSPPVTGFASFRNTITELNVANSIGKVNHLFYISEKSATVLLDIK